MKIQVLDQSGKPTKEIDSGIFDSKIREEIVQKVIECEKTRQEYAPFFRAGMQTSASGNVRHLRHSWKTDRGRGMSRVPKKRMSDRGARFIWEGAVIPGTRGGRRAHPPKLYNKLKKINKKEYILALKSALAMVASLEKLKVKYSSLKEKEVEQKLPIVIDSKALDLKTKDFNSALKKILGELEKIAIQKKKIRAGKGKMRSRKYKKNAGLLLVIGNKEDKKVNAIDIKKVQDLSVSDLASNGARLVIFSETSIKDIEEKLGGKNENKNK